MPYSDKNVKEMTAILHYWYVYMSSPTSVELHISLDNNIGIWYTNSYIFDV